MSHYDTGIGSNVPSVLDLLSAVSGVVADFIQVVLGQAQTEFAPALLEDIEDPSSYDPVTRSWSGTGGLRYYVPLFPIPSERHAREKTRNIKILMDNCRRICVEDELPSTQEEKKFWYSYRFMKYQMFLAPLCIVTPPLYIAYKILHHRMPEWSKGRFMPIILGLAIAEQWSEATYPGYKLLSTALKAKTPMGDAARAEWARLQPVDLPFYLYNAYVLQHFFNAVPAEYQFGGDINSLLR